MVSMEFIRKRYVEHGLLLFLIVCSDWFELVITSEGNGSEQGTLPRVSCMIRIIKIVAVDPNAGTCSESHKHVKSKRATYISCANKVVLFVVPVS